MQMSSNETRSKKVTISNVITITMPTVLQVFLHILILTGNCFRCDRGDSSLTLGETYSLCSLNVDMFVHGNHLNMHTVTPKGPCVVPVCFPLIARRICVFNEIISTFVQYVSFPFYEVMKEGKCLETLEGIELNEGVLALFSLI